MDARDACSRLRSTKGEGKKALPRDNWLAVMKAAVDQSSIIRLQESDAGVTRLALKPIPTEESARVQYHNHLMQLCALSLRDLIQAMGKAASSDNKRKRRNEAEEDDEHEEDD